MPAPKGTGIQVIKNDFGKIADGMDSKAKQIVQETLLYIEGAAKSAVPIGPTGALGSGIQSSAVEATAEGWRGEVFDPVEYAPYVNYGTGSRGQSSAVPERPEEITYTGGWLGMPARPFMSQAGADGRARFEAAMKKIVG